MKNISSWSCMPGHMYVDIEIYWLHFNIFALWLSCQIEDLQPWLSYLINTAADPLGPHSSTEQTYSKWNTPGLVKNESIFTICQLFICDFLQINLSDILDIFSMYDLHNQCTWILRSGWNILSTCSMDDVNPCPGTKVVHSNINISWS